MCLRPMQWRAGRGTEMTRPPAWVLGIISVGRLVSCLYVCVLSVEINSLVLVVNLCVGLAHWGCLEE